MTIESEIGLSRRQFLRRSFAGGMALLASLDNFPRPILPQTGSADPFHGGRKLGTIDFTEEAQVPMGVAFGRELDGRLYTDLSQLALENPITPSEQFYVRTRASELLGTQKPWTVRVGGLAGKPYSPRPSDLERASRSMGPHLMECAGNVRPIHFGLMSVANWTGVPLSEMLERAGPRREATRVLVSGFDRYATKSLSSTPGASWIFSLDQIESAGAFLATGMDGQELALDHGVPVRLLVPGWYGCACIKWVNEITLVDDAAAATSQMQEYASRTMQDGVPQLARDYRAATIDQAAMPTRIERWLVDGKIKYRVVGILWGGNRPVKRLEIRFNPEQDYVRVDRFHQASNDPWSFWTHAWTPKQTGPYLIRLRVAEPKVVARRLDAGAYVRSVEITEL